MSTSTIKILAINPGTRYMGFAVFYGPELRDWGTKVVKGKWSAKKKEKLVNIVQTLIDRHQPDAIAIKKLHPSRSSKQLDSFVSAIKRYAEDAGLPVCEFPIKYLEFYFSPRTPINKMQLAGLLAEKYPDLFYEFNRESMNGNKYYIWMFEAVSIGVVCTQNLSIN